MVYELWKGRFFRTHRERKAEMNDGFTSGPKNDVTRLDRLIHACLQKESNNRPTIKAIVDFLYRRCDHFSYERRYIRGRNIRWCQD
ncbi:hypothetical protein Mgra_00007902 [Meloidogyne graminicola]|uniref:Serine-threonine/tyrosine-protein kinase catalytic domain-containing protein n=1 Tax=Meloidogyne graminicola TaxID=189291 RepID=A0A8S9ZH66_9BILA|nr:hypothetical protein Mgra_00007902 [Meloidogyne graminicola]